MQLAGLQASVQCTCNGLNVETPARAAHLPGGMGLMNTPCLQPVCSVRSYP